MSDENPNPNPTPDGGGKDAAYWEAEAKKAFQDRDAAKRRAKELEAKALTDEEIAERNTLREEKAKAEEEKKRKAGEFDQLRDSLVNKHKTETAELAKKVQAAETKWRQTVIGLAFAGATDVFGRDALTIYGPKAGERIFNEFVDLDEDGTVIVKNRAGNVMVDAETGKPASFSAAMRELIESLPDKNEHLRGSGKAGSGNSGGGQPGVQADITELTKRAQSGDKTAIEALKQRRAESGRLVMGTAFSR